MKSHRKPIYEHVYIVCNFQITFYKTPPSIRGTYKTQFWNSEKTT